MTQQISDQFAPHWVNKDKKFVWMRTLILVANDFQKRMSVFTGRVVVMFPLPKNILLPTTSDVSGSGTRMSDDPRHRIKCHFAKWNKVIT